MAPQTYIRKTSRAYIAAMPCRNAAQKQIRSGHASFVAKRLQKLLNSEPELNRMHSTNRILPAGSLKQRSVRRLFAGWIRKFSGKGRVFTRSLAQQICWRLRKFFSMEPSIPSGEIERMRGMLQTARKRKLGPHSGKKKAMAINPDNLETQPLYGLEAGVHVSAVLLFVTAVSFKSWDCNAYPISWPGGC